MSCSFGGWWGTERKADVQSVTKVRRGCDDLSQWGRVLGDRGKGGGAGEGGDTDNGLVWPVAPDPSRSLPLRLTVYRLSSVGWIREKSEAARKRFIPLDRFSNDVFGWLGNTTDKHASSSTVLWLFEKDSRRYMYMVVDRHVLLTLLLLEIWAFHTTIKRHLSSRPFVCWYVCISTFLRRFCVYI